MNGRILPFEARRHEEAERLLPWLVTDRLDDEEQAWVEQHVAGCSDCRRELEALRVLQAACRQSDNRSVDARRAGRESGDVDRGWRRLRARLQPSRPAREPLRQALHRQWRQGPAWWGWAVAAQALTIVVLAIALWRQPAAPAAYRALGATPSATTGNLVIVFDPHLDELRMRRLLRASEARIVDGPNDAGAYVLEVPAARLSTVRDALRAAPGVTLVATLDADPGPAR